MYFFFTHTPTTEIYTLSLHDALPIFAGDRSCLVVKERGIFGCVRGQVSAVSWVYLSSAAGNRHLAFLGSSGQRDRKSTRLNSSHMSISYAVFCLKKKNSKHRHDTSSG